MQIMFAKLRHHLGLHGNIFFVFFSLFRTGVAIFLLNGILILSFISIIGNVFLVGKGPEAAMHAFYFQFLMIIQAFFFFDPFADSGGVYNAVVWRDLFLFVRLFFAFILWGAVAKLLSNLAVNRSKNRYLRVVLHVMAFLSVSLASIPLSLNASAAGAPCFRNGIERGIYTLNDLGQGLDRLHLLPISDQSIKERAKSLCEGEPRLLVEEESSSDDCVQGVDILRRMKQE